MYIALNYISNRYTPGEIIRDDLPDGAIAWLLKKGAVKYVPDEDGMTANVAVPEEPAAEAAVSEPEAVEQEADEPEEIEPPVIDATEALVTTPAKKPRSRGGKAK